MNPTVVPSTPPNTRGPSAVRLLMAPLPNREPKRSATACLLDKMVEMNLMKNSVVEPEAQPIIAQHVAQPVVQMPRTPEKTHRLPLPPAVRRDGSAANVHLISREEAFLRAPQVHRSRAPLNFRAKQMRNCPLSSPKARISKKHLPSRFTPSHFQILRDPEGVHPKYRSKHLEKIAAKTTTT